MSRTAGQSPSAICSIEKSFAPFGSIPTNVYPPEAWNSNGTSSGFCPAAQNPSYDVAVTPLIELRGLTVELPTPAGWIRPVDDVSFTLEIGDSLGLVGESGSGKSMLALALMGLLPPGARVLGEAWLASPNGSGSSRVN